MIRRWVILVLASVFFVGAGSTLHYASSYHNASGYAHLNPDNTMPWES